MNKTLLILSGLIFCCEFGYCQKRYLRYGQRIDFNFEGRVIFTKDGIIVGEGEYHNDSLIATNFFDKKAMRENYFSVKKRIKRKDRSVLIHQDQYEEKKSKINGTVIIHRSLKDLRGLITLKNGKRNGVTLHFGNYGDVLSIEYYKNDTIDGCVLDGRRDTIGCYKMGVKDGVWRNYGISTYKDGVLHGYYSTGSHPYSGYYENGKKEGWWVRYDRDYDHNYVSYDSVFYQNDRSTGLYRHHSISNNFEEKGFYQDSSLNVRTGLWVTSSYSLDSTRRLISIDSSYYENGQKNGKSVHWFFASDSYYSMDTGMYQDDIKEGKWIRVTSILGYGEKGPYKAGKRNGLWTEQYGEKRTRIGYYTDGKKEGEWSVEDFDMIYSQRKKYFELVPIKYSEWYQNGELIRTEKEF